MRTVCAGVCLAVCAASASAQEAFTVLPGSPGLSEPPPNAVTSSGGDGADVHLSAARPRSGAAPALGNGRFLDGDGDQDGFAALGLVDGDQVDALDTTPLVLAKKKKVNLVVDFSVRRGALGLPGTAVATAGPASNGADVFSSARDGTNVLSIGAARLGLASAAEVTAIDLQPAAALKKRAEPGLRVYFSLGRDSPTLATLGASPADVLAVDLVAPPGPPPVPFVVAPAATLGLDPAADNLDGIALLLGPATPPGGGPVLVFSVDLASSGAAGTAVAASGARGATLFSSAGGGDNFEWTPAANLGLADTDELDALDLLAAKPPHGKPPKWPGGDLSLRVSVCSQAHGPAQICITVRIACQDGATVGLTNWVNVNDCKDPAQVGAAMAGLLAGFNFRGCAVFGAVQPLGGVQLGNGAVRTAVAATVNGPWAAQSGCCVVGGGIRIRGRCDTIDFALVPLVKRTTTTQTYVRMNGTFEGGGGPVGATTLSVSFQPKGQAHMGLQGVPPGTSGPEIMDSLFTVLSQAGYKVQPTRPGELCVSADPKEKPIFDLPLFGVNVQGPSPGPSGLEIEIEMLSLSLTGR